VVGGGFPGLAAGHCARTGRSGAVTLGAGQTVGVDDVELIGGPEKRVIVIEPYNPAWSYGFETHRRRRIIDTLGAVAGRVDHVGSTAVPGLAAKPIVDIQVSVGDVEDEASYLERLVIAGYQLRVREPGHRMFRTPELDVHIHVCDAGSDWERRHLLLRDWLRRSANDREAYADLKIRLLRQDWDTMNHYADAKSALIAEMSARAEQWAMSTAWSP
jgi:GrpB-like predicted nucleotidyltransferase (UPF0157 family)